MTSTAATEKKVRLPKANTNPSPVTPLRRSPTNKVVMAYAPTAPTTKSLGRMLMWLLSPTPRQLPAAWSR